MRKRVPVAASDRPPIPEFTPPGSSPGQARKYGMTGGPSSGSGRMAPERNSLGRIEIRHPAAKPRKSWGCGENGGLQVYSFVTPS